MTEPFCAIWKELHSTICFNFLENDNKQVKRTKKIFVSSQVSEAAVLRICFMQYT